MWENFGTNKYLQVHTSKVHSEKNYGSESEGEDIAQLINKDIKQHQEEGNN